MSTLAHTLLFLFVILPAFLHQITLISGHTPNDDLCKRKPKFLVKGLPDIDEIFLVGYIPSMAYDIEYTDEFGEWWEALSEGEQEDVASVVGLLEAKGPQLPFPHSSGIKGSKRGHMRELRIQHRGNPYRVLYAFDPRRMAILLLGGDKTGDDDWYEKHVPIADKLYDEHLEQLKQEARIKPK